MTNERTLRVLILASIVIWTCAFAAVLIESTSGFLESTNKPVEEYTARRALGHTAYLWVGGVTIVGHVIAWLGLWNFWKWSRELFVATTLILDWFSVGHASNASFPVTDSLGIISGYMVGAIMAICYLGEVRHRFNVPRRVAEKDPTSHP